MNIFYRILNILQNFDARNLKDNLWNTFLITLSDSVNQKFLLITQLIKFLKRMKNIFYVQKTNIDMNKENFVSCISNKEKTL